MRELRGVVLALLGLVLAANVVTGGAVGVLIGIVGFAHNLTLDLQTVMLTIALPALLVGGLIWLSPWHREFAVRIVAGALVLVIVAVLGPGFLHWLQGALAAYGQRLFGGAP